MKTIYTLIFAFSIFIFPDDSLTLLKKAQSKISDNHFLSYDYTILWPNPAGEVDTLSGTGSFSRKQNEYYDYNYIKTEKGASDLVYIDNEVKQTLHSDSTVVVFTDDDVKKNKRLIADNSFVKNSPLALLVRTNWAYVKDTTILSNEYATYRSIETDTLMEKDRIYVAFYAFVNKTTALLDRYERRNFVNGRKSQFIIYSFSGYELSKNKKPLTYVLPENYRTQVGMKKEKLTLLRVGELAPFFSLTDLKGDSITLQAMHGEKTLLVFSDINCGYCVLALNHFNRKGYHLPMGLTGVYLFPNDKKEKLLTYTKKIKVPFQTGADAKDIGKAYGVTGYPTFFLINEHGIIEKVVVGYEEKFVESLQ